MDWLVALRFVRGGAGVHFLGHGCHRNSFLIKIISIFKFKSYLNQSIILLVNFLLIDPKK
jgi:hypothetical protein